MKKLYVGNLPYSYKSDTLAKMFEQFGEVVSSIIITDKVSGRSKGFGFVELEDDAAQAAIDALNGTDVDGRNIVVNEARPKKEF